MARKPRPIKYSILIVCEGTATEPNYFKGLSNEIRNLSTDFEEIIVAIDPKPKEDDPVPPANIPHKSARKKRELQQRDTIIKGEIEPQYAADPVRYVRTAQLGLADGTYEEAYAVFDQDGHPRRGEAYDLAEKEVNGKKVQIGFSSISFEHWVLIHFELNQTPFEKSECKDDAGRYLGCGMPGDTIGCRGNRCVAGYIRENDHHGYNKNGRTLWNDLRTRLTRASRHAAVLRNNALLTNPDLPIYDLNPYTDLDLVIGRILRLPSYMASVLGQTLLDQDINYRVDLPTDDTIRIHVENQKNEAFLFNSPVFFSDDNAEILGSSTLRKLLNPGGVANFDLEIPGLMDRASGYLNIQLGSDKILTVPLKQEFFTK